MVDIFAFQAIFLRFVLEKAFFHFKSHFGELTGVTIPVFSFGQTEASPGSDLYPVDGRLGWQGGRTALLLDLGE